MSWFFLETTSVACQFDLPVLAYIGPGAGITFLGSFLILFVALGLVILSVLTWPIRFVLHWWRRASRGVAGQVQRVVVVGLDGLDPERTRRLIDAGKLPHLQSLKNEGTFIDLGSTLPPISPVAWSTFMTGVNPGKHNIFDFLNRDLRTYLPELSSARVSEHRGSSWLSWLGLSGSQVRLLRKSQPFWKVLGDYGIFSTILRVPITFPPEKFHGLSLSAMCTPDLRGTQGTFTLYSTNAEEDTGIAGGLHIPVTVVDNRISPYLPGPPDLPGKQPADLQAAIAIKLDPKRDQATLHVCGQQIVLKPGVYTDWVRVKFRAGFWTTAHGVCRFRLETLSPHFRLYVSPINIDPERPAMPISHPLYYSIYLAKLQDTFATLGLAEDTWGLNSGALTEAAFLEHAYSIHDERERMFFDALRRTRRGLCACVFDASDRIQHMFYRYDSADHPANPGKDCTQHLHAIDEMYARMDDLVGRVRAEVDDETLLMVISDHGFCDFSRGVNLNVWLQENGYLALQEGAKPGDYLAGVDWSKTRAYAFGISGIYLNQEGRESQGIVKPGAEAAAVRAEISAKLQGLRDPARGGSPIHKVYEARQSYHGPYAENGPDLLVGYNRGYRASWETAVGRTDGPVIADNTKRWSGDHCVDPNLVPGVFFCNRKLMGDKASIMDLAPTILKFFGVPVPTYMDGRPLDFESVAEPSQTRPPEPTPVPVPAGSGS